MIFTQKCLKKSKSFRVIETPVRFSEPQLVKFGLKNHSFRLCDLVIIKHNKITRERQEKKNRKTLSTEENIETNVSTKSWDIACEWSWLLCPLSLYQTVAINETGHLPRSCTESKVLRSCLVSFSCNRWTKCQYLDADHFQLPRTHNHEWYVRWSFYMMLWEFYIRNRRHSHVHKSPKVPSF